MEEKVNKDIRNTFRLIIIIKNKYITLQLKI